MGAGGIGAFVIHAAARAGATVTAVDVDDERLSVVAALGACATVRTSRDVSLGEQLGNLSPTVVYECTGVP